MSATPTDQAIAMAQQEMEYRVMLFNKYDFWLLYALYVVYCSSCMRPGSLRYVLVLSQDGRRLFQQVH